MNLYKKFVREFVIFFILLFIILFIILFHFLFHPVRVLDMDTSIFYMDEKYTLATFLTVALAFLTGFITLYNLRVSGRSFYKLLPDLSYGLFFIILSLDEFFEIHEYVNNMIKTEIKGSLIEFFASFSWVIPLFGIIMAVFTLLLVKIKNSREEVRPFLIAGFLCFVSVLFLELIGASAYGLWSYLIFVGIEEGLEMTGISFFLLVSLMEAKKRYNCNT